MNTYSDELFDPLYIALRGNMRNLQPFVDEVLADKYNGLKIDGFTWNNDMQIDFNYDQLQKEIGIYVMANYVDLDSPAIPIAHGGDEYTSGKIPRMKSVEYFNEDKIRKLAIYNDRRSISGNELAVRAGEKVAELIETLVGGHVNALTYQRQQMVSKGELNILTTNNPRGIANVKISAQIPAANKVTKTGNNRWWTSVSNGVYSSEGSSCDPIADLQGMAEKARKAGLGNFHFEVQNSYMDQVLKHSSIVDALKEYFSLSAGVLISSSGVALFNRNTKITALGEIVGAPIRTIDHYSKTQKFDTTTHKIVENTVSAFEDNVFVLVPDGSLGEVLTVEPMKIAGGEYANYFGGKLLLRVSKDYSKNTIAYETEMTSLCVCDKVKYMWYLHPYGAN